MDGFQYQPLLNLKGYCLVFHRSILEIVNGAFFPSRRSVPWITYNHDRMEHCGVLIDSKVVPCQYIMLRDFSYHVLSTR